MHRFRLGGVIGWPCTGWLAAAVVLVLTLAGCASDVLGRDSPAPSATSTLTDPTGRSLTMPAEPKAALGFYTTDVDILITLGIPLAKMQPIRGDAGYQRLPNFFPQAPLEGVSTFPNYPEYNFEKVLEAEPDFILNGLGYDAKTLDKLPEIAPTYSVNAFDGQDWRVHFKQTAHDLGRTPQYEQWNQQYQDRLAEARTEIEASPAKGWRVAALGYWGGNVQVGCYGVACRTLRDDLKLNTHELMKQKEATLSPEQLGQLGEVDAVFMDVGVGEQGRQEHAQTLAELNKIPTWRELPFVKSNRVYTYEMEMTFGSPSGQTAFLETIRKTLVEEAGR